MFVSIVVATFQIVIFLLFFLMERLIPARNFIRAPKFYFWCIAVNAFALTWFAGATLMWIRLPEGFFQHNLSAIESGLFFYLLWSFFGYWWHRLRHVNHFLWRTIHKFHHSPPAMESAVAYFKHPFEYGANSILITVIAWFFNLSVEAIIIGLSVEGALEVFHHSNIRIPQKMRFVGYVIQTPEMHLIHHERGLHKYNYATFLWDSIFGTVMIPSKDWNGKQGFATGNDIRGHFFLKN